MESLATSFGISIITLTAWLIIAREGSFGDDTKNGVILTGLAWHRLTEPIQRVATVMVVVVIMMVIMVVCGGNWGTGYWGTGYWWTGYWWTSDWGTGYYRWSRWAS